MFKAIDVPLFKHCFNLKINNDLVILLSLELLNFYKMEKLLCSAI